ncbi:MAG: class I SAM-dependent methyltransferase [Planctomycetota bacterium]|nr:class I SAM-dependent methyltransferase [Planctomycetota bacterium]
MARSFTERAKAARQLERWTQVYRDQPELFRSFERAEDPQGLAAQVLAQRSELGGKRVLEIGCGTGWLTRHVAPQAGLHVAVEPSAEMLGNGGDLSPAHVLRARGERLRFQDGSFDRIVMSWVLLDLRPPVRNRLLQECERLLPPQAQRSGPAIWVIENAGTGEFQALRDLVDGEGHGEVTPLVEQHGFTPVETVPTWMRFPDEAEARLVLGTILGVEAAARLDAQPRASLELDLCVLAR